MNRLLLGSVIAAVVLFLYGFLYWGGPIPYGEHIWKQTANDTAAGQSLLQHFPEKGTYFVPAVTNEADSRTAMYSWGPVAMVHMLSPDGRPEVDPSIMIQGFFVNLAFILVIGLLLRQVVAALPTYGSRVMFAATAGLACTLLTDIGDIAWWTIDWQWRVYTGFYHFSAWVIVGLVLAAFVGPSKTEIA